MTLDAFGPVQPCSPAENVSVVAFPLPSVSAGLAVMVPETKHIVVPLAVDATRAPATSGESTSPRNPAVTAKDRVPG
jgi:hypothetical protein